MYRILIVMILSLFAVSCNSVDKEHLELANILRSSFDNLYLAKYGLDYPHTKHTLNKCIKYNDQQCLIAYNLVLESKNKILSLSDTKSLETTLDIIETTCSSEDERIANFTCYGGIMSLYFYDSSAQDKKIFERINKYPKAIKNIIFNNEFYWFHNRPKRSNWINYISTIDVDWEQDGQKEFVLNMFKRDINQIDGEPWVLR